MRPISTPHEDAAADDLRATLNMAVNLDPIMILTVSNFSKAMFAAICLFLALGCLFAMAPGA